MITPESHQQRFSERIGIEPKLSYYMSKTSSFEINAVICEGQPATIGFVMLLSTSKSQDLNQRLLRYVTIYDVFEAEWAKCIQIPIRVLPDIILAEAQVISQETSRGLQTQFWRGLIFCFDED